MDTVPQFTVELTRKQDPLSVPAQLLQRAVAAVLEGEGILRATISLVVVDDRTIHELNRQFLNHDYPTDVLSFVLDDDQGLDGEVIVSAEMAQRRCVEFGWSAECELLWYVLHGTLHLCGYDDQTPAQREEMERLQRLYLQRLEADRALPVSCGPVL